MMTQKKMENDLTKYLWSQFINGNTRLENLKPKDVSDTYNFTISQEDLNEKAASLRQVVVTLYTDSQITEDGYDMWSEFEKAENQLKQGFDFSKYSKMNKEELGSYIYRWGGRDNGEHFKGNKLISDITERLLVSFYFESKFVS